MRRDLPDFCSELLFLKNHWSLTVTFSCYQPFVQHANKPSPLKAATDFVFLDSLVTSRVSNQCWDSMGFVHWQSFYTADDVKDCFVDHPIGFAINCTKWEIPILTAEIWFVDYIILHVMTKMMCQKTSILYAFWFLYTICVCWMHFF